VRHIGDQALLSTGGVPVPAGDAVGRWVSYMRTATTSPDAAVRTATAQMAASRLTASAMTPATRAPTAKPLSRHTRYTPTAEPRQRGWATSATVASRVG